MSRKASPAVVGGFVIGGIVLILAGILMFGGRRFLVPSRTFVLYFEGSLHGLQEGAPVLFRGVKVGTVSDLIVRYDSRSHDISTPVYIQLEDRIEAIEGKESLEQTVRDLIDRGLRAHLALQSLITGQLVVILDLRPDTPIRLVGSEPRHPEIPTVRSTMDQFTSTIENLPIEELVDQLLSLATGIDEFIRSDELADVVSNLNTALDETSRFVAHIDESVDPITKELTLTAEEARAALKQTRESVARLEDRVDAALRDIQSLTARIESETGPIAENVNQTLEELRNAVVQARTTLTAIERTASEDSLLQTRLATALDEFARAARTVRSLADYLERHPESLLRGKTGE